MTFDRARYRNNKLFTETLTLHTNYLLFIINIKSNFIDIIQHYEVEKTNHIPATSGYSAAGGGKYQACAETKKANHNTGCRTGKYRSDNALLY